MAMITLEAVEAVMEQAQVQFPEAKEALVKADGDVAAAVRSLVPDLAEECISEAAEDEASEDTFSQETSTGREPVDEIVEKLKKLVQNGNVDRIVVSRGEETLLNIPVNVGLLGSVIGLAAAPWAVIAAAVAAFGFSCKIEIVKKDGTKEEVD